VATSTPLSTLTHVIVTALPPDRNPGSFIPKDKSTVSTLDLGTKIIVGIAATGTRTITTVPAGAIGNSKDILIEHEEWVSNDLGLILADSDTSPLTGTRTSEIVSLHQTAPPTALFQLPDGYTIKNFQMPGSLLAGGANQPYLRALNDIENLSTREKAADDLIAYAKLHPLVQNHVAHVLAANNTHFDDAALFATQSVEQWERLTSIIEFTRTSPIFFNSMDMLAEYWDTLGWVHYVQGDVEGAKRYCQIAWNLGGEGLYIGHVARIAWKQDDDKETAGHLLQVALAVRWMTVKKRRP
jgi:hypothetical protein